MADGTGPGRITLSGVILAALILVLIVASLYLFIAQPYWFPSAGLRAWRNESTVCSWRCSSSAALLLFLFRAHWDTSSRVTEKTAANALLTGTTIRKPKRSCLIVTAVILTVLVFMGQRVWASIYFVGRADKRDDH